VDSLKLWLAWKFYGDNGYRKRMDNLLKIADYFARRVREDDRLELMAEPQSITICFRYLPPDGSDINAFNLQLREELRMSGKSVVNYGYIGNDVAIRFIAANAETETKDIDRFFDSLLNSRRTIPSLDSNGSGRPKCLQIACSSFFSETSEPSTMISSPTITAGAMGRSNSKYSSVIYSAFGLEMVSI
jgi:glutamate/tyrosine decarboxylase-like PLP-dependent enzyme